TASRRGRLPAENRQAPRSSCAPAPEGPRRQPDAGRHGRSRTRLPAARTPRGRVGSPVRITQGASVQTIFIMVKCELGKAYEVADEAVQNIEQVSEVYSISGQFDLLMKCYLTDEQDIGHFVMGVQKLPGVKDTFTLITFKAFS